MDTDLYDLAKAKARPCSISFSPDGKSMAVRAFDFRTGKLRRKYDESRRAMEDMLASGQLKMDAMDLGKKSAVEKELE
ncbi:unnamed protein product, partial [Ectocarpus sp. 8 AP-2014]